MMTVRFPSGFSVQYNEANFASRSSHGFTDLYTKHGGSWIAQVPTAGAVLEVQPACRTYNPVSEVGLAHIRQLEQVERELRAVKRELALARKGKAK